jgi:hypothetical protein
VPSSNKSKIFTLSLILSTFSALLGLGDYYKYFLDFGAPAFQETDFHKMKGRETLSRSKKYLNTADDNMGHTELHCIL